MNLRDVVDVAITIAEEAVLNEMKSMRKERKVT